MNKTFNFSSIDFESIRRCGCHGLYDLTWNEPEIGFNKQ